MSAEKINYAQILSRFPWIMESGRDCILSPDCDGLLCGLLMANFLDWKIRGFYDGKTLLVGEGVNPVDCVFLDMEICRENVRSIGQHLVMYDRGDPPANWGNFHNCISPNNIRGHDYKNHFMQKYPFGTIHFLMAILNRALRGNGVAVRDAAICPLLYVDGVFKNLFNYPENCLSWFDFLDAENQQPLKAIFLDDHYSIPRLMNALNQFFQRVGEIGGISRASGERKHGDKIKLEKYDDASRAFPADIVKQAEVFLGFLSNLTGWKYRAENWQWKRMNSIAVEKLSVVPAKGRYMELMARNPLSFAIISRQSIEATVMPTEQNPMF